MLRVRGTSRVLAVLGDPVEHSISPVMHNAAMATLGLDGVYVAFRVPRETLAETLHLCAALDIAGNLTVPLKQEAAAVIPHLTDLARELGAVNTFWCDGGGLHGDNTDVPGLAGVLGDLDAPDPWLLCGTGGAARAVAAVAGARGARLLVQSRASARAAAFCEWAGTLTRAPDARPDDGTTAGTVINATPLGLAATDPAPAMTERLSGTRVALDLVYRPGETAWVRGCRARGLTAVDGRALLLAQGVAAFERFFPGRRAPREQMRAAVRRALRG